MGPESEELEAASPLATDLCNAVSMKNKNKRELEKHWAKQALEKEKAKPPKKTIRPGATDAPARLKPE